MFLQRRRIKLSLFLLILILTCLVSISRGEGEGVEDVIQHNNNGNSNGEEPDTTEEEETVGYNSPDEQQQQQQQHSEINNHSNDKCAWGTACHHEHEEDQQQKHHHHETAADDRQQQQQQQQQDPAREEEPLEPHPWSELPEVPMTKNASSPSTTTETVAGERINANNNHLSFVHHHGNAHPNSHFVPPEGFAITARVYTDPADKLAHFTDDAEGTHITLPYWECGATGSTTSPLPVKHAYFRHSLSGCKPQVWSGTEYGPHPQLIVALKRMVMTLNSGETKQLKPGDVVLLEDVVSGGHKLTSLENELDMTYLLLTLPQHYHHVGKDRFSLKQMSTTKEKSPCRNINSWNMNTNADNKEQQQHCATPGSAFVTNKAADTRQQQRSSDSSSSSSAPFFSWDSIAPGGDMAAAVPLKEGRTRKLLLGAVGVSLSTLMADFLGKVAPLWLAVGIGGTCFVVGGTAAFIKGGDYLIEEIEMWQERKRLDVPPFEDEDEEVVVGDEEYSVEEEMGEEEAARASS